jgi:hypothetical protein
MHPALCRILWVGSFFGTVAVLVLTGGKVSANGYLVYEDPQGLFTIEHPKDYRAAPRYFTKMTGQTMLMGPAGSTLTIGAEAPPPPQTPDMTQPQTSALEQVNTRAVGEYWKPMPVAFGAAQPKGPESRLIKGPKGENGKPIWVGYETDVPVEFLGEKEHILITVLQCGEGLWSLTAHVPEARWLDLQKELRSIVQTFKPKGRA